MAKRASPAPRGPRRESDLVALADHLHSTAIHLLRRLRRVDAAAGLPAPQLSAMSVIVFGGGPVTLGDLARAEGVRPPTMTRIVGALLDAGLVAREVDATDRRVVRVRATAKGQRLLEQGRGLRVAALVR